MPVTPREVFFAVGLVNLRTEEEFNSWCCNFVLTAHTERLPGPSQKADVFRNHAAGWVVNGRNAPFARIIAVSNPTPEEAAAANV